MARTPSWRLRADNRAPRQDGHAPASSIGLDPRAYDAATIRKAILPEAQRCSPAYTKTMTTALRGYLRFLAAADLCPPGLEYAVPLVPQWRLSSLPRYLSPQQVARLIASCAGCGARGIRDRAILLLLSRLGLRAGDILEMRLGDIDWSSGTLRVKGKGRRETRLPLPQDAGDAVLVYLDGGRPSVDDDHLFLRSDRAFPAVLFVLRGFLYRGSGFEASRHRRPTIARRQSSAPFGGDAHATGRRDAPVGRCRPAPQVAGNHAHYAKVDLTMLAQIAQPWPGEATC